MSFTDFVHHVVVSPVGSAQFYEENRKFLFREQFAGRKLAVWIYLLKHSIVVPFIFARERFWLVLIWSLYLYPSNSVITRSVILILQLKQFITQLWQNWSLEELATENEVQAATNHRKECNGDDHLEHLCYFFLPFQVDSTHCWGNSYWVYHTVGDVPHHRPTFWLLARKIQSTVCFNVPNDCRSVTQCTWKTTLSKNSVSDLLYISIPGIYWCMLFCLRFSVHYWPAGRGLGRTA